MSEFQWRLAGRCYKLGHDVPHAGGVVPNRIIVGRHFDAKDIIPHLFEETDPGFHQRCKPGDIIVAGRNFGCGSHRPATVLREVGVAAILVESASRLFLRNTIALPMPIYVVPGINEVVHDGETLEIDYANRIAKNVATGASIAIPKFPPMIEEIYRCGGLPQLARQRYLEETRSSQ
jgi:3-isopropylmalate dehydratase small subunit